MLLSLMMIAALLTGAAGDVQPPPQTAATPTQSTPPQKPPKPPKPPKPALICEDAPQTGSIISHRVCATREEWDRRSRQDQDDLARGRDHPLGYAGE